MDNQTQTNNNPSQNQIRLLERNAAGDGYILPIFEIVNGSIGMTENQLDVKFCKDITKTKRSIVLTYALPVGENDDLTYYDEDKNVVDINTHHGSLFQVKVVQDGNNFYPENAPHTAQFILTPQHIITGKNGEKTCMILVKEIDVPAVAGVLHESVINMVIMELVSNQRTAPSEELGQVIIKLREAIMWLGKVS